MLKGILLVVLIFGGRLLVFLGYGKRGMKERAFRGEKSVGITILWTIVLFIWLFFGVFFIFMFPGSSNRILSLIALIGCPIPYILWVIHARKSVAGTPKKRRSLPLWIRKGLPKTNSLRHNGTTSQYYEIKRIPRDHTGVSACCV